MKLYLVYGKSYNAVVFPITVFSNKEKAIQTLQEILGVEPIIDKNGDILFKYDSESKKYIDILNNKIFSGYYGGCGGCYSIRIKEVEDGELRLFMFSLD